MKERLEDQIAWYDDKSAIQKKIYYWSKAVATLLTASIPVCTGLILKFHYMVIIVSIIAALCLVIESILSLTKVHEKWIEYRSITETLRHEKYMYLVETGVYDNMQKDDKFKFFVERIESIISQENNNWANLGKNKSEEGKS